CQVGQGRRRRDGIRNTLIKTRYAQALIRYLKSARAETGYAPPLQGKSAKSGEAVSTDLFRPRQCILIHIAVNLVVADGTIDTICCRPRKAGTARSGPAIIECVTLPDFAADPC